MTWKKRVVLQREPSVVLQMGVPALRIPETVDDTCSHDGVFHCLVNFSFQILCYMQVVPDGCGCIDQFLRSKPCQKRR